MSDKAELEQMLAQARSANDRESAALFEREIARLGTAEAEAANSGSEATGAIGAETSAMDKFVGHGATRVALGAANLVLGPLQLGANIGDKITEMTGGRPVVGKWMNEKMQQLEAMKTRGMKAHGNEGFDWAGLAGNMAGALPMALTRTLAKTAGEKMAQGAGVGAAMGAGAPVVDEDYWKRKQAQIYTDAAIGTVIPGGAALVKNAVKAGGSFLKAAAEPITKEGRKAIEGRFLNMVIPQEANARGRVLEALMNPQKQLVAGSAPTAGELVSNIPEAAALAAHQKQLSRNSELRKGETPISSDFSARYAEQDKAQIKILEDIAGTPEQLMAALKTRKDNIGEWNEKVVKSTATVNTSEVKKGIKQIIALHPKERAIEPPLTQILQDLKSTGPLTKQINKIVTANPADSEVKAALSGVLKKIKSSSKKGAEPFDIGSLSKEIQQAIAHLPKDETTKSLSGALKELADASSPRYLSSLSKDIKRMIAKTSDNKVEYNTVALTKTKESLDKAIGEAEDAYGIMREGYRNDSKPINRMNVGQALKDSLVNPLGQKTPSSFSAAMHDPQKTIKDATGFGKLTSFDDVLGNQKPLAENVLADLKRKQAYDDLADKANSPVSGGIHATVKGAEGTPGIPRLLSTPATMTNFAMKLAGQSADGQINKSIADKYLNPEKLASLLDGKGPKKMTKAQSEQRSAIIKALLNRDWNNTSAATASILANQENK